ncbi:MAG: GNAT family N-acetyltransferase [Pseudomonadota bacterium]
MVRDGPIADRLILRRWREEDRAPFAIMNADPGVMEYFQSEMTREQSDALVDRIEAHFEAHGLGLFALERKRDGAFLGFTGFASGPKGTPVGEDIEIGWRIAHAYWRQGYAFEAARACMDWFWKASDRQRVVSYTADQNKPSQALMRKLGLNHRPDLDFDHPSIPKNCPVCHQTVFVLKRDD